MKEMKDKDTHMASELSAEVIDMFPARRKNIYGDYKETLSDLLEEKYR
jgi:hypothetical protein